MSERKHRRRIPSIRQKNRIPHPSPSPSLRRRTPTLQRSKSSRILQRCKSEPILWSVGFVYDNETRFPKPDNMVLFRPNTCTDVLMSPFMTPSSASFEKYDKDAKVIVNVTVDDSPGPVRTLVQLGATVQETIKLVVDKYSDEGRRPHLDRDAAGEEFELHHSHFSLESIKKTDTIGDVGSRSFYLRTNSSCRSSISITNDNDHQERLLIPDHHHLKLVSSYYSAPEIIPEAAFRSNNNSPDHHHQQQQQQLQVAQPFIFFSSFVVRKFSKLGRRTRRIWKVLLGCM